MTEAELYRALIRLALDWYEDSQQEHSFMPDTEGDKIARARTKACAISLLRTIGYLAAEVRKEIGS